MICFLLYSSFINLHRIMLMNLIYYFGNQCYMIKPCNNSPCTTQSYNWTLQCHEKSFEHFPGHLKIKQISPVSLRIYLQIFIKIKWRLVHFLGFPRHLQFYIKIPSLFLLLFAVYRPNSVFVLVEICCCLKQVLVSAKLYSCVS